MEVGELKSYEDSFLTLNYLAYLAYEETLANGTSLLFASYLLAEIHIFDSWLQGDQQWCLNK